MEGKGSSRGYDELVCRLRDCVLYGHDPMALGKGVREHPSRFTEKAQRRIFVERRVQTIFILMCRIIGSIESSSQECMFEPRQSLHFFGWKTFSSVRELSHHSISQDSAKDNLHGLCRKKFQVWINEGVWTNGWSTVAAIYDQTAKPGLRYCFRMSNPPWRRHERHWEKNCGDWHDAGKDDYRWKDRSWSSSMRGDDDWKENWRAPEKPTGEGDPVANAREGDPKPEERKEHHRQTVMMILNNQ